jgi:hypothetical protein
LEKLTPISIAIPIIKADCIAEIKEMASILPSAIDEREAGETSALFKC